MKLVIEDESIPQRQLNYGAEPLRRSRQHHVSQVLFLVSVPPSSITATFPPYQNPTLPQLVQDWGAQCDIRSWRDGTLDATVVSKYDKVTFLWCNDYHEYPEEFLGFLEVVLMPVRTMNPRTHIFNDPRVVFWNANKHYLADLAKAGFRLPHTEYLDVDQVSRKSLLSTISNWSCPLVLKPSISGSARNCHLINVPTSLTSSDVAYLDEMIANGTHGDLVLQEYMRGITAGEWSLMFVNGKHTHTVLKVPQQGEFRINGEFGGRAKEVPRPNVPQIAVDVAQDVLVHLQTKFSSLDMNNNKALSYARIDGVMHGEEFVLMEVEVIEPHMWLEKRSGCTAVEELKKLLVAPTF